MTPRRLLAIVLLLVSLLASASLPTLDTASGWDATSYAGWPGVGLSACLFIVTRGVARWRILVVQAAGLSVVLSITYGVPWWQGLLASFAVTLPGLLSDRWLMPGSAAARRFNDGEPDAYHGVTAIVGLICGSLSALAASAAGRGDLAHALLTGLISFFAATTAQLVLLPFCLRSVGGWASLGHSVERWGQRAMLMVFAVGVFYPHAMLPVTFLIFPVLGWAAIRATAPETHLQVLFVSVVAFAATLAEHGPLALESLSNHSQFAPLLVYMFIASICYLLIPLAMTVERLTSATRRSVRAATTVQRMLDSATGTVFIATDRAGCITLCNPGAEAALGLSSEQLLGRPAITLHTEREISRQAAALGLSGADHRELYMAVTSAQIASGLRRDWEFTRIDGERRVISLNLSRLVEPNGQSLGFIASGEDITERVKTQHALEEAFRRERSAVETLRAADDMKQELVSIVSHELRTPITNINGYAELLRDGDMGDLSKPQASAVDRISRNGARLHQLVDDLLTLSRAEADALQIFMESVDLNDVALAAEEMLTTALANRHLTAHIELAPYPVIVSGDRNLLERAVANLWSNAIKFTPDGGEVGLVVGIDPAADDCRITVSDTGIGIAQKDQGEVFDRFFRTESAGRNAVQGSGLGLSIVKTIVEQHGGVISLDSAVGSGTTIAISLARHHEAVTTSAGDGSPGADGSAPGPSGWVTFQ